jgi:RNA polymerase sigma-70 factor (ECF subfamily)
MPRGQVTADGTEELVGRAKDGDRAAAVALYERFFDPTYRYAQTVTGSHHDAEDVTQTALVAANTGIHNYDPKKAPYEAWLFGIVRNTAFATLKKRSRHGLFTPLQLRSIRERSDDRSGVLARPPGSRSNEHESLIEALGGLSDAEREVLALRFVLDWDFNQIAALTERTPAAVRKIQQRALEKLRASSESTGEA